MLPTGWVKKTTKEGKIYYQNNITRTTQWARPRFTEVVPKSDNIRSVIIEDNDPVLIDHSGYYSAMADVYSCMDCFPSKPRKKWLYDSTFLDELEKSYTSYHHTNMSSRPLDKHDGAFWMSVTNIMSMDDSLIWDIDKNFPETWQSIISDHDIKSIRNDLKVIDSFTSNNREGDQGCLYCDGYDSHDCYCLFGTILIYTLVWGIVSFIWILSCLWDCGSKTELIIWCILGSTPWMIPLVMKCARNREQSAKNGLKRLLGYLDEVQNKYEKIGLYITFEAQSDCHRGGTTIVMGTGAGAGVWHELSHKASVNIRIGTHPTNREFMSKN